MKTKQKQHYQQGVSSTDKTSTSTEQSCPRLELLQNEVFCSGSECVFFLCQREGGDVEYLQENAEDVLVGRNRNGNSTSATTTQTPLSFALVPNDDYDDDDDEEEENGGNSTDQQQQDQQTTPPTTKSNNNRPTLQLNSFLENDDSFSSSYRPTLKISKRQPTLAVLMCSHSFLPNYTGSTIWRPNSVRDPTATELADGMIQRAAHSTLIPIRRVPCTILGQYHHQLLSNNSGSGGSSLRIKSLQMELFSTVENIATLTCALTSACFEDCWFGLDQVKSMNSNSKYQLSSSSSNSSSSGCSIEFITDDRTRVASEVITFKARYSTSTSSSEIKNQQGKQQQNAATSEIIKTDINSSKIIFGYFSLLSAKGWIPGSGETIRCSFRLFKFPKQKEEEDDEDENTKEKEGTTTSNVRDPSDDSSDDEEGKNDDEDDFNVFAECVGECTVDLCL